MPNPDITKDLTQGITISELAGGAKEARAGW